MSINRIFEGLSKVVDSGSQEKTQPKSATPLFVSTTGETNTAEKRSNQQIYGDYRRNQIQARWTELQQNQVGGKLTTKQTAEIKPMYDGVKTTVELNQKLLETIKSVDPQPTGIKSHKLKSGKILAGGVSVSESVAKSHVSNIEKLKLKAKFEAVGQKYRVPPALLAAIASRESNMSNALNKTNDVFFGWGDKSKRSNEKVKQWHGFGLMQIDKNTGELPEAKKELLDAYSKEKLDPYSEHHIDQATQIFLIKLGKVRQQFPNISAEKQIATAVSRYNGGYENKVGKDGKKYKVQVPYPDSDHHTTGNDYANDVLVRARYFLKNGTT